MIFCALRRRRRRARSTACSSPTAGWCRSSRRWRCWSRPAAWPQKISDKQTQIVDAASVINDLAVDRAARHPAAGAHLRRRSWLLGWVLLNRTTFGRRTFAVGGNPEAARLAGINVRRHTVLLYALSGLCCGIAAIMLLARTTTGRSPPRRPVRARRDRRGDHRRHAAHRRPRHASIGSLLGVLVFTTHHQPLHPQQPADRGPEHRQGRHHRRRRPDPAVPGRAATRRRGRAAAG